MSNPTFDLRTVVYRLPGEEHLTLYTSVQQFRRKVEKHFLNPSEPWGRLLKAKFLQQLGQKLKAGDVSLLEEAYQKATEVIHEGLRSAEAAPLYVRVREQVRSLMCAGDVGIRTVIHLVAERGFRIVVRDGAVRTAYFSSKTATDSELTLYLEAWRMVKARGKMSYFFDADVGQEIERLETGWFSDETWKKCPIPEYFRFGRSRSDRLPPAARAWLDSLGSDAGPDAGDEEESLKRKSK